MATPTLYHSKLVQMGEVWVAIKTNPRPSTFKGKPPYAAVVIENTEYFYNCENRACEDALAGRAGQTVLLQATGREADAAITIIQIDATPAPATRPAAAPPRAAAPPAAAPRAAAPPPRVAAPEPEPELLPEQRIQAGQEVAAKLGMLMNMCRYEAAAGLLEYENTFRSQIAAKALPPVTPEMLQGATGTLFISAKDTGVWRQLPTASENDQPPV